MRYDELAERVLAASSADQTIVIVSAVSSVNTRWARNELTTNGHATSADVTVIAVHEGADGPRVAALTRPAPQLDATSFAEAALAAARRNAPAWDAAPLAAGQSGPSAGWHDDESTVAAADLVDPVAILGDEIARDAADAAEHFGYLEFSQTSTWLASSTGLALRSDQPAARLELTVKSHGRTRSTWQGYAGRDLASADVAGMAQRARTELRWQSRDIHVAPGHHTALLSPSAVADLMIDLLYGADGRAAVEGRSAFSRPGGATAIGEVLATRPLRLSSGPQLASVPSAPFLVATMSHDAVSVFDNGLALEPTDWIAEGRLAGLVTSRAVASRSGLPVRLSPDNLGLDAAGSGAMDDLIARTDDGLLVTCTWYNRMVDPHQHLITGLTRDGVFVVRGGEVVGRTGNFRFNESPVAMLARVRDASAQMPALGREMADYFTRTSMPALAVADFNFSSPSDAV